MSLFDRCYCGHSHGATSPKTECPNPDCSCKKYRERNASLVEAEGAVLKTAEQYIDAVRSYAAYVGQDDTELHATMCSADKELETAVIRMKEVRDAR